MHERRFSSGGFTQSEKNKLTGYAAVFNSPTKIPDRAGHLFTEVIRPGAFSRSLKEGRDVVCLFNHDESRLLGRTASGTLKVQEDARGLWFEVQLPDTATGNELRHLVERGDISGCSFAFTIPDAKGERWTSSGPTRELVDIDLHDCSVVTTPAYSSAQCDLRSVTYSTPKLVTARLQLMRLQID